MFTTNPLSKKHLLLLALPLLLLCLLLPKGAWALDVFVDSSQATSAPYYQTFQEALDAVGQSNDATNTITLMNDVTLPQNPAMPAKPLTIQGSPATVMLKPSKGDIKIYARAALSIDNLTISTDGFDGFTLYGNGDGVTLGSGVQSDGTNPCFNDVYGCFGVVTGNVYVTINGGVLEYVRGNDAEITGDTYVTINNGTVTRSVAGCSARVNGNTNVIINGGTVKDVHGGGPNNNCDVTKNTYVTLQGSASITGNVLGAGYNGPVDGNTYITISGVQVGGYVCGGSFASFAYVRGNSYMVIKDGATISGNVYAGGKNDGGSAGHVYGEAYVALLDGSVGTGKIVAGDANDVTGYYLGGASQPTVASMFNSEFEEGGTLDNLFQLDKLELTSGSNPYIYDRPY